MTKIAGSSAWPLTREPWTDFAPMVGRIVRLGPATPIRLIEQTNGRRTALAKLPSGALVDRTIAGNGADFASGLGASADREPVDVTALAGELASWLGVAEAAPTAGHPPGLGLTGSDLTGSTSNGSDLTGSTSNGFERTGSDLTGFELTGSDLTGIDVLGLDPVRTADRGHDAVPERADAAWRGGRPPSGIWQRVETVPGEVVRDLVRQGAEAHIDAADQGLGARAADALLDLVVLTVTSAEATATVTNRSLSALSSMGFLPVGGNVVVSVHRGWTRVAAEFGSSYAEPVGRGLVLL